MKTVIARTRGSARLLATASVVCAAAAAQPAFAQSANSTLDTSATVTENCVIDTTPLSFGNVDVTSGSVVDGAGGVDVVCTSGTDFVIAADAGEGTSATITTRQMTDGTNLLNYAIYTDSGRTTVWGDGTDGSTIDSIGTGVSQDFPVYGRVAAGQTALPAGAYSDTVAVTVTY